MKLVQQPKYYVNPTKHKDAIGRMWSLSLIIQLKSCELCRGVDILRVLPAVYMYLEEIYFRT